MSLSSSAPQEYSRVYDLLVENDEDVIGLVAYAIYKQHKRDWLLGQVEKMGVRPPPELIRQFEVTGQVPSQIARYRASAHQMLRSYAESAIADASPAIGSRAVELAIGEALRRFEASSRWYRQIPTGFVSALVYTVFLIAFALVLRYAGIDLAAVMQATASLH